MSENFIYYLGGGIALLILLLISFRLWKISKGKFAKQYYDNKKLRHKVSLDKMGKSNGTEKFYYRTGQLNKEQTRINNELQGISKIYYPTGELYITSNYIDNQLNGDYMIFDKKGNLIKHEIYENGLSVNSVQDLTLHNDNEHTENQQVTVSLIPNEEKTEFENIKQDYQIIKEEEETKDGDNNKKGFLPGLTKIGKKVSGVEAYQNRKSSRNIKEACEIYYEKAQKVTETARESLNKTINDFGKYRLESLQSTTGRFLGILKDMDKSSRIKEYEILDSVGINTDTIQKMNRLDMEATTALKSTATVGALGAAAAMGTPALVSSAVGALATASTGTAISTLSGAAATNATLAWLGGGSLAAGGTGVAGGAAVLSALTAGATAGIGLVAAGLIASTYYSKKLTEAKEYQKNVETHVVDMELLWGILDSIKQRTEELKSVTMQLEKRLKNELEYLEPLAVDFSTNNNYYNTVFQRTGLLAKSMSELAQAPLLDEDGNASIKSAQIIQDTNKVLNTNIVNHG